MPSTIDHKISEKTFKLQKDLYPKEIPHNIEEEAVLEQAVKEGLSHKEETWKIGAVETNENEGSKSHRGIACRKGRWPLKIYFEAGALTKKYCEEKESFQIRKIYEASDPYISRITLSEIVSAIMKKYRKGEISNFQKDEILKTFWKEECKINIIEINRKITQESQQLLLRHALKASDSLQLASFSVFQKRALPDLKLVCFDNQILKAAIVECFPILAVGLQKLPV